MFGYGAQEILGRSIDLLIPPDRFAEEELILDRLRRGERIDHYDTVRRRKDGAVIHVSISVSPLRNLAGEVVGASKIARDITEQKLTRARLDEVRSELFHVSRLSTMGQMASSLAHELNQPLTALRNYFATLRRLVGAPQADPAQLREIVALADEQAARAGDVIRHLREFVATGDTEQRLEDLNDMVEEAVALALVEARQRGMKTSKKFAQDLPPVLVDRVQIQQVVLNLVRNAAEAMDGVQPQELTISTARRGDAPVVEIAVADTGPGIAPDIAARLFQPFVSSKKSGLGIGLSICREIVEAHGGRLSASPNAPKGTVFSVMLPVPDQDEANGA
jgi:two-component system sensor kinase FixL